MENKRNIFRLHPDWHAITLCVIAAGTFWFFNAMNQDHTADVSYPIEITFNEEEMIPSEEVPTKVKFNATGFGWNLLRRTIRINRPPVVIDLEAISNTSYITAAELLPILKSQLNDIKINYLIQDTIYINFDKLVYKSFPLRVDSASISLVPGYKLNSKVRLEPDSIQLRGPAHIIKSLKDSFYVNIPEKNIDSHYDEDVTLNFNLPPSVTVEPEEVEIEFTVEKYVQQSIPVFPNYINFPADSSVIPSKENVIFTALIRPSDEKRFTQDAFQIFVDLKLLNKADSTVPVTLNNKPDYIKEYFFSPPAIKILQR